MAGAREITSDFMAREHAYRLQRPMILQMKDMEKNIRAQTAMTPEMAAKDIAAQYYLTPMSELQNILGTTFFAHTPDPSTIYAEILRERGQWAERAAYGNLRLGTGQELRQKYSMKKRREEERRLKESQKQTKQAIQAVQPKSTMQSMLSGAAPAMVPSFGQPSLAGLLSGQEQPRTKIDPYSAYDYNQNFGY